MNKHTNRLHRHEDNERKINEGLVDWASKFQSRSREKENNVDYNHSAGYFVSYKILIDKNTFCEYLKAVSC